MPGPFDPTPAIPFIDDYITAHASEFSVYAARLGLPPPAAVAAASAVAEEMRNTYLTMLGPIDSPTGYITYETFKDQLLDFMGGLNSNASYAYLYSFYLPQITDGTLNKVDFNSLRAGIATGFQKYLIHLLMTSGPEISIMGLPARN
jgi:hypothetical protein